MTYRINITKSAEQDMIDAAKYIAHQLHNPIAAERLLEEADKAIYSLAEMPQRHPLVLDDYLANQGIRLHSVRNHLVVYVIYEEEKTVIIKRFLYGRRDWANILRE